MNKELIKKYKNEFDHWLNGGKLQAYYKNDTHPKWWTEEDSMKDSNQSIMEHILTHNTDVSKVVIVIDDAYIEYRKALVEGKTVEYEIKTISDRHIRWVDILDQPNCYNTKTKVFNYEISTYRIKPEEPQFKVGDWVRDGDNIYQFIEPSSDYSYQESLKRCTLWKPKPDEWYWFWNTILENPVLAKFTTMYGEYYGCAVKNEYTKHTYRHCEPFIGQLPTNLKTKE